ncbi:MAG: hypothetical protein IJ917_11690 [Firmicutes bacterium]|nr:hypothetical protein [Bacillota bacterium]
MLKLPLVFSDHMVLQRNKKVRIFGQTEPNALVSATLISDRVTIERSKHADETGAFCVNLPPLPAGYGRTLIVQSGAESVRIEDVAVGEVWLAGGQSNMEYLMNTDAEKEEETKAISGNAALRERLRFFDYPEVSYEGMLEEWDLSNFGLWRKLTEQDLPYFSAVSYYFMRKIASLLEEDVPIAVIGCNWGGTRSVCWLPEETVKEAGGEVWLEDYEQELEAHKDQLEQAMEQFKEMKQGGVGDPAHPDPFQRILYPGFTKEEQEQAMAAMGDFATMNFLHPLHYWRPCGLYHTMLQKIMPYTLRGFIWYQGCSDEFHPDLHQKMLSAVIHQWRKDFQDEELPFLLVQLAPFEWWLGNGGEKYPELRAQQLKCADMEENVYAASIGDAGMRYDIHPKYKRKPGERLGLLALQHVYDLPVQGEAPRAVAAKAVGDQVEISFANGAGLHLEQPTNGGWDEPITKDPQEGLLNTLKTVPEGVVSAQIQDDKLILKLTVDGAPVLPETVSFAWEPYYEIDLYNKEGLPAFPFQLKVE